MNKLVLPLLTCFLIGSLLYANTADPLSILFQIKEEKEQAEEREAFSLLPKTSLSIPSEHSENGTEKQIKHFAALFSELISRFGSQERHVAIRRSTGPGTNELKAVEKAMLSRDFPYFVWENLGQNIRYELYLGDDIYHIGPGDEDIVRVKIRAFQGTREFNIKAFERDKPVAELTRHGSDRSYKNHVLQWMSSEEMTWIQEERISLNRDNTEKTLRLGRYLEENDMWIAAMDLYRGYLDENRQNIEITPYLFKTYKQLKLQKAYHNELKEWRQAMKK